MRGSVLLNLPVSFTCRAPRPASSPCRTQRTKLWLRETVEARDSVLESVSKRDIVVDRICVKEKEETRVEEVMSGDGVGGRVQGNGGWDVHSCREWKR